MGIWQIQGGQRFDQQGEPIFIGNTHITVKDWPDRIIVLREDDLVFPSLADFHVHTKPEDAMVPSIGVYPSDLLSSGVMLAGDGGTRGWGGNASWSLKDELPITKVWVSLNSNGLDQYPLTPYFDGLTEGQSEAVCRTINSLGNKRAGLKIRLGQHDRAEDQRLWRRGISLARSCQVPVMVHITGTFLPPEEILEGLEAHDVLTHVFHGQRGSLATGPGLLNAVFDCVGKGVILDVGHGSRHFSWSTFHRLCAEGLTPDTISTDLTRFTYRKRPVYDLPFLCSKLVAGGLSWSQIYRGVLTRPYAYYSLPLPSDSVVILRYWPHAVRFDDGDGQNVVGKGLWRPVLVVAQGQVIRNRLAIAG